MDNELVERLKLEAQIHAQEARTANATIAEIYQLCSGAKGEPGNWHGAEPVRALIAERDALAAALRQQAARVDESDLDVLRRLRDALPNVGLNGWTAGVGALDAAIAALAALAQNTQGEAVAWEYRMELSTRGNWSGWMPCERDDFGRIASTGETEHGYPAEARALYTHAERARVPDGMVLVPREPTPEMLAAVEGSTCSVRVAEDDSVEYPLSEDECAEIYRNMLAAAPSQPKDAGEVRHG